MARKPEQHAGVRSPTRQDVAAAAGVSVATVSYVLNNSVRLPDATRDRVLAAARELDYRPNLVARSLATSRTMQLAIVLNNISNPIYADLILGFEGEAIANGYFVTICTGSHNVDDYFDNFAARGIDGLFVEALPDKYHEDRLAAMLDAGIPAVTFGNPGFGPQRISVIENDYADAMTQIVEHLAGLEHERIVYVSGLARAQRSDARIRSFSDAMRTILGVSKPRIVAPRKSTPTGIADGERLTVRALERYPEATAIVCTNDLMAVGALRAARGRGLRVPDDLSVVGIDNAYVSELCTPALTTVAADFGATGARAFHLLQDEITHGRHRREVHRLRLIARESTGPAATRSARSPSTPCTR